MKFDTDSYLRVVGPLDDADIDYTVFRDRPLEPDVLRCVQYMHDVEHHTTCYLRDLLVTRAHDDPVITSFLAMWAYEEYWHGEALGKVLANHAPPSGHVTTGASTHGRERIAATRRRVGADRLRTLGFMALSTVTDRVVGIAMVWGAINEWTTQAGYLRLATISEHDVLSTLLRRIAKQEGRHIDFYAAQAEERLADTRTQWWARTALRTKWSPVGSNVMPRAETDHLVSTLFGGPDGLAMARRIDDRIHRLPGLDDLDLITGIRGSVAA